MQSSRLASLMTVMIESGKQHAESEKEVTDLDIFGCQGLRGEDGYPQKCGSDEVQGEVSR